MLFLLLFSLALVQGSTEPDGNTGITSCEKFCDRYTVHTENDLDPLFKRNIEEEACLRGCRFYMVADLVSRSCEVPREALDSITPTAFCCRLSCVEAYNKSTSASGACKDGCGAQEEVKRRMLDVGQETGNEIDGEDGSFEFLRPLMQIKEITSKVVGMMRIIKYSITMLFVKADDQTVVALKGPTEIRVEVLPEAPGIFPAVANELPEVEKPTPREGHDKTPKDVGGWLHPKRGETDRLVSDPEFPGVTAIRDVPEMSLGTKYVVTTGLAIMVSICFAMIICMAISNVSKKLKPKDVQKPPLPKTMGSEAPMLVKVIRTEDLTKLSIMEEDEKFGMKVPESSQI